MLKEGWDVTNLYTIVPLRAANSRTLVEQSIGRGLRLPYGKRTGVAAVDRLTIVAHDRFQEIVDEANKPDSIIRTGVVIGRDIPTAVEGGDIEPVAGRARSSELRADAGRRREARTGRLLRDGRGEASRQGHAGRDPRGVRALRALGRPTRPEVQKKVVERVVERLKPSQPELFTAVEPSDVAEVVKKTIEVRNEMSIDIPRIVVVPTGEVGAGSATSTWTAPASTCSRFPGDPDPAPARPGAHRLRRGDAVATRGSGRRTTSSAA